MYQFVFLISYSSGQVYTYSIATLIRIKVHRNQSRPKLNPSIVICIVLPYPMCTRDAIHYHLLSIACHGVICLNRFLLLPAYGE